MIFRKILYLQIIIILLKAKIRNTYLFIFCPTLTELITELYNIILYAHTNIMSILRVL